MVKNKRININTVYFNSTFPSKRCFAVKISFQMKLSGMYISTEEVILTKYSPSDIAFVH